MGKQHRTYIRFVSIVLPVAGMFIALEGGVRAAAAFPAISGPSTMAGTYQIQQDPADGVLHVPAGHAPPAADPGIDLYSALIGTVVVDGGRSVAVFALPGGHRLVRTGEEIFRGVRLLQVRRNQIEIERGGIIQELGPDSAGIAALASDEAIRNVNRLLDLRRQKVENLNRLRARSVGRKRG